jgi:PAS domain S-box-containing protein
VPIVFLTAQAVDADMVRKGYRAGAVDYLVQPLAPEVVQAKVAVFVELHRQRRRIQDQARRLLEAERREGELRLVELRLAGERRFRSLADAVPHIIWTARADGYVDYFNQRWFEYTGISIDQAAGSWQSALSAECAACRDAWTEACRSGRMLQCECRLRRSDGSLRWHLARAVPERGPSGQVVAWLGTFTDIEDQKRAYEALAEFKGTLDAVLDAVLLFEPRGWRCVYVNAGASMLLGYSPEELSSMRLVDFMGEHDDPHLREELLARLEEGATPRVALETQCRKKDGRLVPVDVSFQLVKIDGGHVVAIARDITDRKLAELEREHLYHHALEAVRARDEFLSVASHELRTPLSSLKLHLEALLRAPGRTPRPPPPELVPKLETASQQVDKLSHLISELMDVTRIRAGRLRLELEPVDLAAVTRDVVARFREDAVKAGCEVTLRADAPVRGRWDSLRMEQVITNLLSNALKFGAREPIEIVVTAVDARARLVVQDHGIGINPEDVDRVFERFERTVSARRFGGMGLGLYIVRQIVEGHGGTIRVESEPGAGSVFTVDLPQEPALATNGEGPG